MRNTKQGSSGNLVWTSISDGVIRRKDRSQRGLPGHYRGRHMPVSAKLAEKVGIAISRAERAYLVAESKPNVGLPLHRLSSTCFDCPRPNFQGHVEDRGDDSFPDESAKTQCVAADHFRERRRLVGERNIRANTALK